MRSKLAKIATLTLVLSASVLPVNVSAKSINEDNISKNVVGEMSINGEKGIKEKTEKSKTKLSPNGSGRRCVYVPGYGWVC